MMPRTFAELQDFAARAQVYRGLRQEHPRLPAATAWCVVRTAEDNGMPLREAFCNLTLGHSWSYSGTAYGGDDDSYRGEGRCLCAYCGADGDA